MGQPRDRERVKQLLEWRLADAEKQRRGSTLIRIHLLLALLYHVRRQDALVMSSLLQALEIAHPADFVSPFLVEGRDLLPWLRRVPREHEARQFADQILSLASNERKTIDLSADALTDQEINILRLMAQGHTNPEIAGQLVLAVSTVRWYAKHICRKLGVHNRTQAAIRARKLDLL